ncbi:glutathione S-transferase [Ferrovibrio sp.]|uniref:glutathione S-transferase n=1 Tax=Ferrovibrio sp. TaxID=1917215 RepID=UPI0025C341B8|nr:glutathione S-transferase [Ferrovibrio sp.]MBX3453695.1 glutathione S-transferase [Ferrovibrio sp.]
MKLYYSPASPFVRKVMVCAILRGLDKKIEHLPSAAGPVKRDHTIVAQNPSGKVPTMLLKDGSAIYDSRVICEYLDNIGRAPKLFPKGAARWPALTLASLADEALDAALLCRYEVVIRPKSKQWADWSKGQMEKITSSVGELEKTWLKHLRSELDIGTVTAACLLGYLDFRFSDYDWRKSHPKLAAWFKTFSKRPAMAKTTPHV